ncbi:hypothetical protein E2C01_101415 [Portunus trituberculatus]|uniref:Uncharacterized protein n=1 Tax=Portunus trituberculatus TaxID=210409 RepID=A0A5B7KKE2_PORTR|nr:hypothetical protein [Portunus trituberculatus]
MARGNSTSAVANQRPAQQRWMVKPITWRAGRRYVTSHASFTPPTTRHQLLPPPLEDTYPGCDRRLRRNSTFCTVRPRPQMEPATDEVSQPRLVFRQAPPPQTSAWATNPSFLTAAPHLSQPSCPTTDTSTTPAVFPPLPQCIATVPSLPPNTVPQAGNTQELPATDATQ